MGTAASTLGIKNIGQISIIVHDLPRATAFYRDTLGLPLTINGLWALKFGTGGRSGPKNHLLFTAGIGDEGHGLFGVIRPVDLSQGNEN